MSQFFARQMYLNGTDLLSLPGSVVVFFKVLVSNHEFKHSESYPELWWSLKMCSRSFQIYWRALLKWGKTLVSAYIPQQIWAHRPTSTSKLSKFSIQNGFFHTCCHVELLSVPLAVSRAKLTLVVVAVGDKFPTERKLNEVIEPLKWGTSVYCVLLLILTGCHDFVMKICFRSFMLLWRSQFSKEIKCTLFRKSEQNQICLIVFHPKEILM